MLFDVRRLGLRTVVAAALLAAVICAASHAEEQTKMEAPEPSQRAKLQLAKLFDFGNYKTLFKKRYGSLLEELDRRRLYLASAFRAFVTGTKYKFRQLGHYESVNPMSDRTPAELERMRNKVRAKRARPAAAAAATAATSDDERRLESEFLPAEDENVEAELKRLVEEHGDKPAYSDLRAALTQGQARRKKRDIDEDEENEILDDGLPPRELPPLINLGAVGTARSTKKVARGQEPPSNNPLYKPIELASFGLNDQQVELKWWRPARRKDERPVDEQLRDALDGLPVSAKTNNGVRVHKKARQKRRPKPDVVWFDHRDSGCLAEVRNQGDCGCCYAFAGVAMMEWRHCMETGQLVEFSEQYLVDCGNGRYGDEMAGCNGATDQSVATFVQNFGMELRSHYPYREREQSCPYDDDFDLEKTGYIRFDLVNGFTVEQARWAQYIDYQPLLIGVNTSPAFHRYGGGVDDGAECGSESDHAVVLVGHGREDGREYWLIRNSHGAHWGEAGYYKLAKRAAAKCLDTDGVAFGTKNGREHTVQISSP